MKAQKVSIEAAFKKIYEYGWDSNAALKWNYFFFNSDKNALLDLYNFVKDDGYTISYLQPTEDSEFKMKLSKIEIHDVDSLHERNLTFNCLVVDFNVRSYDGWEVEK